MHDELKLEACDHSTLRFHSGGYYVGCPRCGATWVAVKSLNDTSLDYDRRSPLAGMGTLQFVSDARTTPANTEADVERVASDLRSLARRLGREYGLGVMDDTLAAIKKAADDLSALSLTRPAGGEEVEKLAREILERHVHPKVFSDGWPLHLNDVLRAIKDALTKPPALPKEGEEAIRTRAFEEAARVADNERRAAEVQLHSYDSYGGPELSGRKAEAQRAGAAKVIADRIRALATPQQVKEGGRG